MADVSDDSQSTIIEASESEEEIKEKIQQRCFRNCAFYGSCGIVVVFLFCLLGWLVFWPIFSFDFHAFAGGIDHPEKYYDLIKQIKSLGIIAIVTLAAIPTTLALALLRYAFSSSKSDTERDSNTPGVWFGLAKEVAEILKSYIKNRAK